jgi:hypothetical protein
MARHRKSRKSSKPRRFTAKQKANQQMFKARAAELKRIYKKSSGKTFKQIIKASKGKTVADLKKM